MPRIKRALCLASLVLFIYSSSSAADQQFNCPNNGTPKTGSDGTPIQCLPGQPSELICGSGYSCFFSGFNYQCCPTNEEDNLHNHHHDDHDKDASSIQINTSNHHHHHDEEHGDEKVNVDKLYENAECPEDTFIVLNWDGSPIPCNPRTKPCLEKGMFCNKYSPIPVCCESVSTKRNIPKEKASDSLTFKSALLPLIPTPLNLKPLQQARFAPSKAIEKEPLMSSSNEQQEAASSRAASALSSSSSVAFAPVASIVENTPKTTTIVNHDMGMDGECTANSVIVMADDGKPIECSKTRRCPLESLLCHKNNQGKSICCQILPRDEIEHLHQAPKLLDSSPKTERNDSRQILKELKQQESELARLDESQPPAETTSSNSAASSSQQSPSSAIASDLELLNDGGSPPAVQPPGQQQESHDDVEKAAKQNASFADNESSAIPLQTPASKVEERKNNGKTGGIIGINVVAHASKTQPDINKGDDIALDVKKSDDAFSKNSENHDATKLEYRPHNQGGYAVLKKLDRSSGQVEDREQRRRMAQRFLLDQIKDGWPYDEKFYRSENVVVMKEGTHPAAIVHFPN